MNWISVKDQLPEADRAVLLTDDRVIWVGMRQAILGHKTNVYWVLNPNEIANVYAPFIGPNPTHWMPLPELPQD